VLEQLVVVDGVPASQPVLDEPMRAPLRRSCKELPDFGPQPLRDAGYKRWRLDYTLGTNRNPGIVHDSILDDEWCRG